MQNSPAARSTVDVGSVIGGTYTIEALIGRGGMGAVFLASHNRLAGKRVAIKVLHAELTDDEVLARFRREAEIAAKLAHPNIVSVTDFNVLPDGTPYLILEYLEGETLASRIKQGPIPLDQAMSIVRQVGSALQAAHREGIVHRDLKPGNIFLVPTERDGRVVEIAKVLDFGISKIRGSSTVKTQDSALLGTPQYMAPEQAIGQHNSVDERTDIFALGAIVYEMLSGEPAFSGASIPEVVFKVVYEEPAPLATAAPTVPKLVLEAVGQAMRKPSSERFATVNGFVEALTGEPLPPAMRPTLQALDAANAGSSVRRRSTDQEAFAQTHASGDYGPPPAIAKPHGTVAGHTGAPVSPQARTVESVESSPVPVASPDARTQLARLDPFKNAATVVIPGDAPPAKRSIRLIVGIAVVCVGAAVAAVYFAMRTPEPTPQTASVGMPKPPPPPPPPAASGGVTVATAGGANGSAGGSGSALAAGSGSAAAAGSGSGSAAKKVEHPPAAPPRRTPTPEAAPGDDAVGQQLKDAEQAVASGNYDLAWRLANGAINTGNPGQQAYAHGIRGEIECVAHNNAEGAAIDLRQAHGSGRNRILRACHARNLLMEQR